MKTLMRDLYYWSPEALLVALLATMLIWSVGCASTGTCGRWREAGSVGDVTLCRGARATPTGMETCERLVDASGKIIAERCAP